jgi:hypothetical protein
VQDALDAPTTTTADDPNLGGVEQSVVNRDSRALTRPEEIPAAQLRDYCLDMPEYVENRASTTP